MKEGLKVRLHPSGRRIEVQLPTGLWRDIPTNLRGMEMLVFLLQANNAEDDRRIATKAAPIEEILRLWEKQGVGCDVKKYRSDGSLDIDDLEV